MAQDQQSASLDEATLITLTSDIVAAHVSNNSVALDAVPELITATYKALASLGVEQPVEARPDPAVSVRASVKKDHIVCLDCGKKLKMLKRHLATDHNLSVEEYRARWKLGADYPVVAPEYASVRRTLAKKIGLGRKPGQSPKAKTPAPPKASKPKARAAAAPQKASSKPAAKKTAAPKAPAKNTAEKKPAARKAAPRKPAKK